MDPLFKYLKFRLVQLESNALNDIKIFEDTLELFYTQPIFFLWEVGTKNFLFSWVSSLQKPTSDVFRYLELGHGEVGL